MEEQEFSIFTGRIIYATFMQRLWAALLDSLIFSIPGIVINKIFGIQPIVTEWIANQPITASAITEEIIQIIVYWLYFAFMESGPAQATIGKQALGIKVTDMDGNRISFGKATTRQFAKYISALILLIGYLMMLWDSRNQTLHDRIAGTLVIKKQPVI